MTEYNNNNNIEIVENELASAECCLENAINNARCENNRNEHPNLVLFDVFYKYNNTNDELTPEESEVIRQMFHLAKVHEVQ